MTRPSTRPSPKKKKSERFFVGEAARSLGKTWHVVSECECPDFIVTEGTQQFGLEVCQLYKGRPRRGGSAIKEKESNTQRNLETLRREYERITNTPLRIRFVGDLCAKNMNSVVQKLVAEDLSNKPIGHNVVIDEGNGLRIHVTRALRADWSSEKDRVGWVDRNPIKLIAKAIEAKSEKLPEYRKNAGPDIRLLIVADRIFNSGKLTLEVPAMLDVRGFQVVYFFSHPESIDVFDCADNKAYGRHFLSSC